ncbi:MAG: insulinase family protein [Bacteroidota bacterium]
MNRILLSFLMAGFLLAGTWACKGTKTATSQSTQTDNSTAVAEATKAEPAEKKPQPADPQAKEPLPFDNSVRTGTLDNGMRYYIQKNAKPENYAELRLMVNAGSLMETEEQLGLAHFTEHMCFNGTKNFPKGELVDYLESIGTRFGAHLNAYTAFDETVYMLRVPTDNDEQFATAFQILEDWAHQVTFDDEEIDKERGVVISEWRDRLGAQQRIQQALLPLMFYNSRYAERVPIGTVEVLENFKPETIKAFYEKWYRPDLMGVAAVGDFDVDEVEAKIKAQFNNIPKREDPITRPVYDVPEHEETLVKALEDEEVPMSQVMMMYKHPTKKMKTKADYKSNLMADLGSSMISDRLSELAQQKDAPFAMAFAGYAQGMSRTRDAYQSIAMTKEGEMTGGLTALLRENERVARHGFTQTELDRAKESMLTSAEKAFNERETVESRRLVGSLVSNFLNQSPVLGAENRLNLYKELLPQITLNDVNQTFKSFLRDESRMVAVIGPKKEGLTLPTEEELRQKLAEIKTAEITPYEDQVSDSPLIENLPEPGKLLFAKEIEPLGVTELRFRNGVKVWLKPTDFKKDQILMSSFSPGGTSLYSDEEYMTAEMAGQIVSQGGIGPYNNIELGKFLSDKVVSVSPYIGELYEGVRGSCSPKDLEVMLQLVHLQFTGARKDETAFATTMDQTKAFTKNILSNPQGYFQNGVNEIMTDKHPRRKMIPSEEEISAVTLDRAFEIYQERFADGGDFRFFFVGDFDIETIQPLITQYIASLPRLNSKESWKDLALPSRTEAISQSFYKGKEPQSAVRLMFAGDFESNAKNRISLQMANQVLGIMLRENLREDKGGVYGVRAGGGSSREPKPTYSTSISFGCFPDAVDDLVAACKAEITQLQSEGPSEKNLSKVREIMTKEFAEQQKSNSYWLSVMTSTARYGSDPAAITARQKLIDEVTPEDVQTAAKAYYNLDNMMQFVLYPEDEKND